MVRYAVFHAFPSFTAVGAFWSTLKTAAIAGRAQAAQAKRQREGK
jgi:hypothetical protein